MNERHVWLFVPNIGTMSLRARICEAPQLSFPKLPFRRG
jgi:hypothetical protein